MVLLLFLFLRRLRVEAALCHTVAYASPIYRMNPIKSTFQCLLGWRGSLERVVHVSRSHIRLGPDPQQPGQSFMKQYVFILLQSQRPQKQ